MTQKENDQDTHDVAIIGMTGRFPESSNVRELWNNLCSGKESISFFSQDELDPSIELNVKNDPNYVGARGILQDAEKFDASFFSITPREAQVMDPQQRVFLEAAWEALEDSGYDPSSFKGLIGVFGGSGFNTYFMNNVLPNQSFLKSVGEHQAIIGNAPDYLATRVSYKLDLKGPSVSLYTGCSSSLVAVSYAADSLLNYQSDIALAGGAFVWCPQNCGYLYQQGEIFSRDGHCRPFDAQANGTVFSNGVGIVVLKRLEEALLDRDNIYAVIKGTAVNNDGSDKTSFTAPSVEAQAEVIAMALANAGVSPESISFVETHGTGTIIGDPIEIEALTHAYRSKTSSSNFCAIGSIKANVGHLDAAAGIAGLIKCALALKHRLIPPSVNFTKPNPEIDFKNTPFYVNTELREWINVPLPRRAGVTSLGVGGTNVHMVLQEAPESQLSNEKREWHLLLLSARTKSALEARSRDLSGYLKNYPEINIADASFTLAVGRKSMKHRMAFVCQDSTGAVQTLDTNDSAQSLSRQTTELNPELVFMFPGQGSEYLNMGFELYKNEKVFHDLVTQCFEIVAPYVDLNLKEAIYPGEKKFGKDFNPLARQSVVQTAIFIIEYALANLWMKWGIRPSAFIGHSIGEYTAACMAGVFSLEDAVKIVAARGRLMESMPPGAMTAVFLSKKELDPYIDDEISIAAINGPSLCVLSGPTNAVQDIEERLAKSKVDFRRLRVAHAFHSHMVEPVMESFRNEFTRVKLRAPVKPFLSNKNGTWAKEEEVTDPDYWVSHLRQTVLFSHCVTELLNSKKMFLEVGPGQTLTTLVRMHQGISRDLTVMPSMRHPKDEASDVQVLLNTLGQLWLHGVQPDWTGFYEGQQRSRMSLPVYPFERQRYWIEPEKDRERLMESKTESIKGQVLDSQEEITEDVDYADADSFKSMGEVMEEMKKLWQDLLGYKDMDLDDDLFELGGDSLIAARLLSKINHFFKVNLDMKIIYNERTIRKLSHLVIESRTKAFSGKKELEQKASLDNLIKLVG